MQVNTSWKEHFQERAMSTRKSCDISFGQFQHHIILYRYRHLQFSKIRLIEIYLRLKYLATDLANNRQSVINWGEEMDCLFYHL